MTSINDVTAVTEELQQLQMSSSPKSTESSLPPPSPTTETTATKEATASTSSSSPSTETGEGIIEFVNVPLIPASTDDNTKPLVPALSFRLEAGQNCVVLDKHKSKKATLFRILDTFLPVKGGKVISPRSNQIYRISQSPYFPTTSNLREQLIYPHRIQQAKARGFDDTKLLELLALFDLEYLVTDTFFNERGWLLVTDWKKRLTASERQRIAFVRMLYHQPQFAILDDCIKPLLQHGEKTKKNIEESKQWIETCFNKAAENHTTLITALSISSSGLSKSTNPSNIADQEVWHSIIHRHARLLNFNSNRSLLEEDSMSDISDADDLDETLFDYSCEDVEGYGFGPFPGVPADKQRAFTLENALEAFAEREKVDSIFNQVQVLPLHDLIAARNHEAARAPETETFRSLRVISKANRPSAMALGRRLSERLPMKSPASNPELIINFHAHQSVGGVGSPSSRTVSPTPSISSVISNQTVGGGSSTVNTPSSLRRSNTSFGFVKATAGPDDQDAKDSGSLQSSNSALNRSQTASAYGHRRIVSKASSYHSRCSSNGSSITSPPIMPHDMAKKAGRLSGEFEARRLSSSTAISLDTIAQSPITSEEPSEKKAAVTSSNNNYPLTPPATGGSSNSKHIESSFSSPRMAPQKSSSTILQQEPDVIAAVVPRESVVSSTPSSVAQVAKQPILPPQATLATATPTILTPTAAAEAMSARRSHRINRSTASSIHSINTGHSSDAENSKESNIIKTANTTTTTQTAEAPVVSSDFLAATATTLPKPSFAKRYSRTPRTQDQDSAASVSRRETMRRKPLLTGTGTVRKSFSRRKPQEASV
ncbi:ATP-binding cassette sub- D member 3 [Mycoemilia scoparia]|uniref:ATP-binding cassette sub- D member 3 n=1 Tax=Mycoemilia scoparia TaxID=417184 RepID=A0A9W8DRL8_9FUNG|nr:ATP-binding cassette sub- D member 3 [Mycoemilia scoparia]